MSIQPNVDTIQEFNLLRNSFSTEYGQGQAIVSMVTKSGSNQIHGEAYWYDRNNDWGARNAYTNLTTVTRNGNSVTATTSNYKPKDIRMIGGFGVIDRRRDA